MRTQVLSYGGGVQTVAVAHVEQYPLLQCAGCGCRFVLLAVLYDESILSQASTYFCPYCGGKQEIDGEGVRDD